MGAKRGETEAHTCWTLGGDFSLFIVYAGTWNKVGRILYVIKSFNLLQITTPVFLGVHLLIATQYLFFNLLLLSTIFS
jgi:hypothetical protein